MRRRIRAKGPEKLVPLQPASMGAEQPVDTEAAISAGGAMAKASAMQGAALGAAGGGGAMVQALAHAASIQGSMAQALAMPQDSPAARLRRHLAIRAASRET